MQFSNLAERKDKYSEFIHLVETSFEYQAGFNYEIDFYPLINPRNFQNCFMLLDQDEVIATCAYQPRTIVISTAYKVFFLGAIAVKERFRNQGLGNRIVSDVLKKIEDGAWMGLWSDKKQFFSKLGFRDYGEQYFLPTGYFDQTNESITITKIKVNILSDLHKKAWKNYYQKLNDKYTTLLRNDFEWNDIFQIHSATYLEIKYRGKEIGYAIADKGMDLQNVVHEFYVEEQQESCLAMLNQEYSVWLPGYNCNWDKKFLGSSLMIKPLNKEQWVLWENELSKNINKELFISGLDSI